MSENSWRPSSRVREPAEFMKPVVDPAGWHPEEYQGNETWIYRLGPQEIAELDAAAEACLDRGLQLMDIGRADFPLPSFAAALAELREEVVNGRGFALIRGLPVAGRSREHVATAFWGIGTHMGRALSQNDRGHLLGHVTDLGADYTEVRGYMTRAHMKFHADSADILSLCCLQPAKSGGAHRICSSVTLYNEMLKRRPDLVKELGFRFYRARNGEIPPGETEPWMRQPMFSMTDGYFAGRGASGAIAKAQRMPGVPPLTPAQEEAIAMFCSLTEEVALDVHFQSGDISFVNNHVTMHSRTAFEDWPEPERKRHILRLWLSTDGARPVHPDIARELHGVITEGTALQASLEVV